MDSTPMRSAVHFDDTLRDRQAKTAAALLPCAAAVDLLEFLENERLVFWRDAGSGVPHDDLEMPVDRAGANFDTDRAR